jgi:signal transduction histidine kinase/DNA-binding response OmpR family regulator
VLGKHFSEIVHPEDVPLCEAFQQELLASGAARHGLEYRIIHEDGSVRWHLSNFIPRLDGRGQVESYVGNAMDITEQKRFQVELKQAREAAEAASQAKSDFLALISHEIRTPLNAIVGFGGLARRTADPSQLRTYIDILDQSAHLLMDLVNDVLDMSKAEAGQLTIDAIPFNLPETLELLLWQFIPIVAKNPRVDVNLCKDDNLPIWIVGDPTRFRQIVSNLLSNALKFTEIGSVILNVRLRATEKGDNGEGLLVVEVRDTGIGIDEDKQTLLFQPFQQLQPGITRKYGGTGLGLTIVRRLVELMGGQITVVSRLGHGSTFTVELPCHPCAPPQYEQLHAAPGGALSVLVVEDNTFNRMLLQETLSAWGYTVTSVANAPDALELMDAHRYDCIILDVWMPGLDGLELALRLRRLEVLSHVEGTPIIAYTADTDERTRQKCRDAGIQAVLFKPLDPQQLALVMNELCSPVGSQAGAKGGGQDDDRQLAHRGLNEQIIDDLEHNPERITTYARLLWEDIDHELNRLDQALQREDRRQIQEASHGLKGLGGYLRDQRGGQLALRLHRAALDHPFPELSELVQQLRQVCIRPSDLF